MRRNPFIILALIVAAGVLVLTLAANAAASQSKSKQQPIAQQSHIILPTLSYATIPPYVGPSTPSPQGPTTYPHIKTPATPITTNTQLPPASYNSSDTQRTFTLTNSSQQTIWAAAGGSAGFPTPDGGGWALTPGQTITVPLTIPTQGNWEGRIWGRTECNFNASGQGTCGTGDCGNGLKCNGNGGAIPASLAEFNLVKGSTDYYDVSLVDGFNLPVTIRAVTGSSAPPAGANLTCLEASCAQNMDSASVCPAPLQVKDASGNIMACSSACTALHLDQYCCAGAYITRDACTIAKMPVDYPAVFKQAVPYAYSWAYDDASSTFTCTGNCNYQIIFG